MCPYRPGSWGTFTNSRIPDERLKSTIILLGITKGDVVSRDTKKQCTIGIRCFSIFMGVINIGKI